MRKEVEKFLNETINPILAAHNGSCELVSLVENVLAVKLKGGCSGCPSAKLTLFNGVEPMVKKAFPEITNVELAL